MAKMAISDFPLKNKLKRFRTLEWFFRKQLTIRLPCLGKIWNTKFLIQLSSHSRYVEVGSHSHLHLRSLLLNFPLSLREQFLASGVRIQILKTNLDAKLYPVLQCWHVIVHRKNIFQLPCLWQPYIHGRSRKKIFLSKQLVTNTFLTCCIKLGK